MSLKNLTTAELLELLDEVSRMLEQRRVEEDVREAGLQEDVAAAVATLEALIGDGDPKGLESIVAARQHSGEEMAEGAHVSFPLVFHGLEILARATLDLARLVGR